MTYFSLRKIGCQITAIVIPFSVVIGSNPDQESLWDVLMVL